MVRRWSWTSMSSCAVYAHAIENLLTEEQQSILNQTTADIDRLQQGDQQRTRARLVTLAVWLICSSWQDITTLVNPLISKATDSWSKHVTPSTLSVFHEDGHWERISEKAEANLLKRTYKSPDATTSWSAMMGSLGDGMYHGWLACTR